MNPISINIKIEYPNILYYSYAKNGIIFYKNQEYLQDKRFAKLNHKQLINKALKDIDCFIKKPIKNKLKK